MLIEFFGRNFGSFRDEFRLSMLATDIDPGDERGVVQVRLENEDEPLRLLRCAAIYGPNASGKSNVLRAARALGYLLDNSAHFASDEPLGPYEPFLLDDASSHRPVKLGLRAAIDGRVYEYEIEFEKSRFTKEQLVEMGPSEPVMLFARRAQKVSGQWTSHEQFGLLANSFRPNALLLSLADRLAPDLAGGITVGLRRLLLLHDPTDVPWNIPGYAVQQSAQRAAEDRPGFGSWLIGWLREADTGVVDYEAQELPAEARRDDQDPAAARQRMEFRLNLIHAGPCDPVKVSYFRESMGTRKMVELAPFVYELVGRDKPTRAYFVDEIGASLHPDLLRAIVRYFNCETAPESVCGQLVFAAQETALLDAEAKEATLRRDQVYFTEKDAAGASRLYSLAEFRERQNLNLRKRYLDGRYGALPAIGRLGG